MKYRKYIVPTVVQSTYRSKKDEREDDTYLESSAYVIAIAIHIYRTIPLPMREKRVGNNPVQLDDQLH